jgi:hypothetical protein
VEYCGLRLEYKNIHMLCWNITIYNVRVIQVLYRYILIQQTQSTGPAWNTAGDTLNIRMYVCWSMTIHRLFHSSITCFYSSITCIFSSIIYIYIISILSIIYFISILSIIYSVEYYGRHIEYYNIFLCWSMIIFVLFKHYT